jgi:hypothetical protein
MTYVYPFLALLLPPLLPVLLALRWWMSQPGKVLEEVEALDLPAIVKAEAMDCVDEAQRLDRRVWLYDLTAPIVMLFVLPFVKRDADYMPKLFRNWDNDVSMNGDGLAILRDGQWLTAGWQITWEEFNAAVAVGGRVYRYSDPDYGGDCYYARGHHPRSFWARYVWLGWRNRASQLSKDLGEPVTERPVCISGNPDIHRNGPYGHFLLKSGNCYHYKSINRWHGLALIRSYGYKLEIVRNSADGTGLAAAVAIGRSLKRRKS